MQPEAGDNSTLSVDMTRAVRGQIRWLGGGLIAVNLLLPVMLGFGSWATGVEYWRFFDGEVTAVNWVSSVQLLFLSVLCCLNYRALGLLQRIAPERRFQYRAAWLGFSAAFFLLALDERFAYHEWLREAWRPGRFALAAVLALGVVASFLLIGHLRRPGMLGLYAAGIGLAACAVFIASVDEGVRYGWGLWYFWDYSFEEIAELWSQALIALSFLGVLQARAGQIGREAEKRTDFAGVLLQDAQGQLALFGKTLLALNLLLPLGFGVYALVTGESFYELFWGERDAISWFSSVQLLTIGLAAWFVGHAERLRRRVLGVAGGGRAADGRAAGFFEAWIWFVFAAGFGFLAIDERFELHELLRDDVLEPGGHFADIPFIATGDIVLYVYLGLGLAFTAFLVRELRAERAALLLFVAAVVGSAVIVVEDSLTPAIRAHLPLPGLWDTAFEEIGEIWVQFLFLCSFLTFLSRRLPRLRGEREG